MKILFCINQLDFADHIAIAYLSGVARDLGHERYLCVLKEHSLADMVEQIKPDVVAYSANVFGFTELMEAHRQALLLRRFISIVGGPHPTFSPGIFDAGYPVDAFCVGEGEGAFHDFLQCVEKGESFDHVLNIVTPRTRNPVRPLVRDLDAIPVPDRDLTLASSYLKDTPKKTFYTTRGCPFTCYYCCNNFYHELYRGKGPIVRRFSVDRIIKEIKHVKEHYNTQFIKFGDDLFAMKADDWLQEFAREYPRQIGIPFNCFLRFDRVDEELLALLKQAGCYSVHLSVDSLNPHVRESILGRKMKDVDIVKNLRLIRSFGINTWVNFMLAAPDSTLEDDLNTIRLARKADVTYAAFSTTAPMMGTKLWDIAVERKLIDPEFYVGDMTGCSRPSELNCFSEREKTIRYNILLLGSFVSRLPQPFYFIGLNVIKFFPSLPVFKCIQKKWHSYNISNRIFRLSENKSE